MKKNCYIASGQIPAGVVLVYIFHLRENLNYQPDRNYLGNYKQIVCCIIHGYMTQGFNPSK